MKELRCSDAKTNKKQLKTKRKQNVKFDDSAPGKMTLIDYE